MNSADKTARAKKRFDQRSKGWLYVTTDNNEKLTRLIIKRESSWHLKNSHYFRNIDADPSGGLYWLGEKAGCNQF
jgi:hypothetical protein